jgi:hypothetical protein
MPGPVSDSNKGPGSGTPYTCRLGSTATARRCVHADITKATTMMQANACMRLGAAVRAYQCRA